MSPMSPFLVFNSMRALYNTPCRCATRASPSLGTHAVARPEEVAASVWAWTWAWARACVGVGVGVGVVFVC